MNRDTGPMIKCTAVIYSNFLSYFTWRILVKLPKLTIRHTVIHLRSISIDRAITFGEESCDSIGTDVPVCLQKDNLILYHAVKR